MKKLILNLFLLFVCYNINSQTFEAKPNNFIWAADSVPKPLNSTAFNVENFLLGFQWSGSPRMDRALNHNAKAAGLFQLDYQELSDDEIVNIIAQPSKKGHNGEFTHFSNATMLTDEQDSLWFRITGAGVQNLDFTPNDRYVIAWANGIEFWEVQQGVKEFFIPSEATGDFNQQY